VIVLVVDAGTDETRDTIGLAVSMTISLLAARFVVGVKLVSVLNTASLIVPETLLTVRSEDVSPA
jgi:hypothetical protein